MKHRQQSIHGTQIDRGPCVICVKFARSMKTFSKYYFNGFKMVGKSLAQGNVAEVRKNRCLSMGESK